MPTAPALYTLSVEDEMVSEVSDVTVTVEFKRP